MARHPYAPSSISLSGYHAPTQPLYMVLGVPLVVAALLAIVALILAGRSPGLSGTEKQLLCWFAITGAVHMFIEGYFVLSPKFYTEANGNLMNEMWKEYAKADSRYATRDGFVVCMEAITAFLEGPGAWAVVYGILYQRPWRYVLQLTVSLGQLYGDILYFATTFYDGSIYSRPEAQYWWGYFILLNFVWVVIPSLCMWQAASSINKAVQSTSRPAVKKRA